MGILNMAGGAVVGGIWKVAAIALAGLLVVGTVAGGTALWLVSSARDTAVVKLKAELRRSAALRAGVDLQNTRIVDLGKEKLAAEKRGAAAQQLAAVNGRRFDGALEKLASARHDLRRGHARRQPVAEGSEMKHIIPVLALLAGCGTAPPTATQIVEVPVYRQCVKGVPPAPVYEFDKLPLDAPAGDKVLALARDWPRGRAYEGRLVAVVAGCQ